MYALIRDTTICKSGSEGEKKIEGTAFTHKHKCLILQNMFMENYLYLIL